jgi:8-oxo-dGTP pyrophosphatase MutT (NUDIX family)
MQLDQVLANFHHASNNSRFEFSQNQHLRDAAVLLPLVERDNQLNILFTKRAEHLKHHAGQISFPGGGYDDGDEDLAGTALRETIEETGISANKIQVIGHANQTPTISQYWITLYLGVVSEDYVLDICTNEVAEAFELPAAPFFDLDNYQKHKVIYQNNKHHYYSIDVEGRKVWGATAKLLRDFVKSIQAD